VRALIIDDSRAMRAIIGKIIKEFGFDVVEAGNGRQGLEQLERAGAVELALVDWHMPDMNGLEFVQAVRAQHTYDGMKVMMITSQTEVEPMAMALKAGANEYLMKPFTRDAMQMKLQMLGITGA
jgi:two-component system chemotaxis response regulator CheY